MEDVVLKCCQVAEKDMICIAMSANPTKRRLFHGLNISEKPLVALPNSCQLCLKSKLAMNLIDQITTPYPSFLKRRKTRHKRQRLEMVGEL